MESVGLGDNEKIKAIQAKKTTGDEKEDIICKFAHTVFFIIYVLLFVTYIVYLS